jgi:hypothetical protein
MSKTRQGAFYCCSRFQEGVAEGKIARVEGFDETEWFFPEWVHIYYCPFCGTLVKRKGFGSYDREVGRTSEHRSDRKDARGRSR